MAKRQKLAIRVVPNAASSQVVGWEDAPDGFCGPARILRVRLAAPPVDGKANAELIKVLAQAGGVRKSDVHLVQGAGARLKSVEVPDTWHWSDGKEPPPKQR